MYNLNRTAAEVQWTANSFADILYHLSSVKIRIMQISQVAVSCPAKATRGKYYNVLYVKANIKRAGKYFAGNFGRGKEWE